MHKSEGTSTVRRLKTDQVIHTGRVIYRFIEVLYCQWERFVERVRF